jgi:hypothetical protein
VLNYLVGNLRDKLKRKKNRTIEEEYLLEALTIKKGPSANDAQK